MEKQGKGETMEKQGKGTKAFMTFCNTNPIGMSTSGGTIGQVFMVQISWS